MGLILTPILGWWFWAVHAAGTISVRAGPRGSKSTFVADRLTDPDQFHAALAFIGLLFLVSMAAFLPIAAVAGWWWCRCWCGGAGWW